MYFRRRCNYANFAIGKIDALAKGLFIYLFRQFGLHTVRSTKLASTVYNKVVDYTKASLTTLLKKYR